MLPLDAEDPEGSIGRKIEPMRPVGEVFVGSKAVPHEDLFRGGRDEPVWRVGQRRCWASSNSPNRDKQAGAQSKASPRPLRIDRNLPHGQNLSQAAHKTHAAASHCALQRAPSAPSSRSVDYKAPPSRQPVHVGLIESSSHRHRQRRQRRSNRNHLPRHQRRPYLPTGSQTPPRPRRLASLKDVLQRATYD